MSAEREASRGVRLRVGGVVQGVGFRYHVLRAAHRLGVRGFVRNLPDGDVEVVAAGDPSAIEELVGAVRQGPRFSKVERLERDDGEVGGLAGTFEIRY